LVDRAEEKYRRKKNMDSAARFGMCSVRVVGGNI